MSFLRLIGQHSILGTCSNYEPDYLYAHVTLIMLYAITELGTVACSALPAFGLRLGKEGKHIIWDGKSFAVLSFRDSLTLRKWCFCAGLEVSEMKKSLNVK